MKRKSFEKVADLESHYYPQVAEELQRIREILSRNETGSQLHNLSLNQFSKQVFGFTNSWHHEEVYDCLTAYNRFLLLLPRLHAKTVMVTQVYPTWLLYNNPNWRIIIASNKFDEAVGSVLVVKGVLEHLGLKPRQPDRWAQSAVILDRDIISRDPSLAAVSDESSSVGKHADIILADDLVTDKTTRTGLRRERLVNWCNGALINMLEPEGQLVYSGNHWHYDDFYWTIRENPKTWKIILHPAILNWKEKEVLWPDQWNWDKLMARRSEIGDAWFQCLAPDQMIHTMYGPKPIQSIKPDDLVLSHKGNWQIVVETYKRKVKKSLFHIKTYGMLDELIITKNHKVFAFKSWQYKSKRIAPYHFNKISTFVDNKIKRSGPDWIKAENLNKLDFLVRSIDYTQINVPVEFQDEDLWWLVGYYLADGSINYSNNRVSLAVGHDSYLAIEIIIRLKNTISNEPSMRTRKDGQIVIDFSDSNLVTFLKKFGRYSHGKKLLDFVEVAPIKYQKSLCDGYFAGDGYETDQLMGANSTSKELLLGLQRILYRQNIASFVHKISDGKERAILSRSVRQKPLYNISIYKYARNHGKSFIKDGFVYSRIRYIKIGRNKETTVYNLNVDKDHSYTLQNVSVANCQFLNDPGALKGEFFDLNWIVTAPATDFPSTERVQAWDFAESTSLRADFSCCATGCYDRTKGYVYVDDICKRKLKTHQKVRKMIELYEYYEPRRVYVEKTVFQTELANYVGAQEAINVEPLALPRRTQDKTSRILSLQPWFQQGKIIFPEGAEWIKDFEEEFINFPNAKHDDMVDSLEMLVRACTQNWRPLPRLIDMVM